MHTLYLLSVWLHILAAMVWIGGMFFLVLVNIPILKKPPFDKLFVEFLLKAGERFRWLGWTCFGIIAITGYLNLFFKGITIEVLINKNFWLESSFGKTLAEKLFVFLFIILISLLHDFHIGSKAVQSTDEATQKKFRFYARWMGRMNMLLALIILWLAVNLAR